MNFFRRVFRTTDKNTKHLEAVIEIGSTGIRLLVAEIAHSDWVVIDHSELPIPLGRDVFTTGNISRETLLQTLLILNRFREQLQGWAIAQEHIHVIATSALREAKNNDAVIDRIFVKTGFSVNIIDGIEENRLMYMAVADCLKKADSWPGNSDSIILEVGGGSTEIMLIEKGKIAGAHSLRLGTVIIEQQLKSIMGTQRDAYRFLEEFIRNTGGSLNEEINLRNVEVFIAVGGEARLAAAYTGKTLSPALSVIERESFDSFVESIQEYTIDECAVRFKIPYYDAQSVSTNLLAYKLFMKLTNTRLILVPHTSIREGLIISKNAVPNDTLQQEFNSQITASAYALARKYRADEKHAGHVCLIALKIFDTLQTELGLNSNSRTLLEASSILHDIGMFIRGQDHHLHGQYIIKNSEIFGLSRSDIAVISQVVYYHRGSHSLQETEMYAGCLRRDRVIIIKLASILRIADAMDRGHTQKIQDFSIEFKGNNLIFHISGIRNTVLEKLAISEKADMFESVFGYKVLIT